MPLLVLKNRNLKFIKCRDNVLNIDEKYDVNLQDFKIEIPLIINLVDTRYVHEITRN